MKKTHILNNLGLTDHESNIYVSLLKHGPGSASEIENNAKLHRPLVYKAITTLLEKGLIRISPKGKRKLYSAESPEKLEQLFSDFENTFDSNIEELYKDYEKGLAYKPKVLYSEGEQAIKDSYMDLARTLKKDDTYYRYASMNAFNRDHFLPKGYRTLRDGKGLERNIITSELTKKEKISLGAKVKVVPKSFDLFDYNIGQVIYGDKVAIVDYDSQEVITITHPKFAKFQEKIFKLLFSKL